MFGNYLSFYLFFFSFLKRSKQLLEQNFRVFFFISMIAFFALKFLHNFEIINSCDM